MVPPLFTKNFVVFMTLHNGFGKYQRLVTDEPVGVGGSGEILIILEESIEEYVSKE
jgi:hypothetical protein